MRSNPLIDRIVCLSELSKDLEGELRLLEATKEECRRLDCRTLEAVHLLDLKAISHACDSRAGARLDGRLTVGQLVHKYRDADGNFRGVHEGAFRWRGSGVLATGWMQGMTNAGTHRAPAFDECQRCDDRGVMEGLLVGTIRRSDEPRLVGCELRAAYRLRFDPSSEGGGGGVRGTLEGAIVCDCKDRPTRVCIDFATMAPGSGPNPRTEQGVEFMVFDFAGAPTANTQITTMGGGSLGLDTGFSTEIRPLQPCSAVEATLVTFAAPASIEAYDAAGVSVGSATMTVGQGVPQALQVSGGPIGRVVVTAPSDETLLLRFCFTPAA